jgi:hypothetical protein
MPEPTPYAIATLLTSGLSGPDLANTLLTEFRSAGRWDFALGAATAVSLLLADLAIANVELELARRELAARGVRHAA